MTVVIIKIYAVTHTNECETREEAEAWAKAIIAKAKKTFPYADFVPVFYEQMVRG